MSPIKLVFVWVLCLFSLTLHAQSTPNAVVKNMFTTLNVRAQPNPTAAILAQLSGGTPITVFGRLAGDGWYQLQTESGVQGWAASGYITLNVPLDTIPVVSAESAPVAATPQAQAPAEIPAPTQGDAVVITALLNLRASPSTAGAVIDQIANGTALTITGRTANNQWLQITTSNGQSGWVWAALTRVGVDLGSIPVIDAPIAAPISNLGANVRLIFARGQRAGNRSTVFSKVGDSITVDPSMYDPIGRGIFNLGAYGALQDTIRYFTQTENSFTRLSAAAGGGWTTATVLDPNANYYGMCQANEMPLLCEYRLNRPAIALIMLGSNDVRSLDVATYQANLQRIVTLSSENGVIPVISTIPVYIGYEGQVEQFNAVIRETAQRNAIPLWDYHGSTVGLPYFGLSDDGLHPSQSPRGYEGAADFTGDNLRYGYVVRNLTALQALDVLRQSLAR
ncbi:MAG: SH3 domain-containing protein [Anaerolineae bacterium]|jgi:uncharacterized protein YgiM (DUF1202 family)|nr:SH3 domain-containing protein [Anaerolineae bacterium]